MKYGREEDEWDLLVALGYEFLKERARMKRTSSYTEMNVTLARRTGLQPFDFEQAQDRAAMGELLGRIVDRDRPQSGLMISALVQYLDANDAGPGFYSYAQELGLLSLGASKAEKEAFWIGQVKRCHERWSGPQQ